MNGPEQFREKLIAACKARYAQVLRRSYGTSLPDRGKLIREGLRRGQQVVELTSCQGSITDYIDALRKGLEAEKAMCRLHPNSEDGWDDEDGDVLGGLTGIQQDLEALVRELGPG